MNFFNLSVINNISFILINFPINKYIFVTKFDIKSSFYFLYMPWIFNKEGYFGTSKSIYIYIYIYKLNINMILIPVR